MAPRFFSVPTALEVAGVCLCLSQEEFDTAMVSIGQTAGEEFSRPDGAKAWTIISDTGHLQAMVCLSEGMQKSGLNAIYGILVHEAVHVWQAFREAIGEDRPGSEQEAYAISHICEALFDEYTSRTTPKRRKK